MSERIEYTGDPLPTGLPGFGGGTVTVVELPGISSASPTNFGPTNDLSISLAPGSSAPAGSNPEDPTDEEICPATVPPDSTKEGCKFKVVSKPGFVAAYAGKVWVPVQVSGEIESKLLNTDGAACVNVIANLSPLVNILEEIEPDIVDSTPDTV